jgi:hypothetical protein
LGALALAATLLTLAIADFTAASSALPPATFTISGQVTDGFGNAVTNATVTLSGAQSGTTTSDSNGNYSFPNLQGGGNYNLGASFSGWHDTIGFSGSVNNLSSDVTQNLRVLFFSDFRVTVKDASGMGIASVGIRINNGFFTGAQTNSFGVANIGVGIPMINSPPATFQPEKVGYSFSPSSITLPTGNSTQSVNFTGTVQVNPIDDARTFVRQQYLDFLNRSPDQTGWDFWTNTITSCGNDQQCLDLKRVNASAAFFLSIEFQETGYLVYRFYKGSFGNLAGLPVPIKFNEFLTDATAIGQGVVVGQAGWEALLESNKQTFASNFVQSSRFTSAFDPSMTPAQFADKLFTNAGVIPTPAEQNAVIAEFGSATTTADVYARARALRLFADNPTLKSQEFNRAFVLMQYFGYLRRNPNDAPDSDFTGYNFWLTKLNQFNGNFVNADMVKAFITSSEYRHRFGP